VARSVIPAILTNIYRSLDQGDPQAARQYLSGDVLNDAHRLDAICMPYSYRAHYVSSVIERPGPVFEARVRTLFKPFEVRAQVFSFIPSMGSFMLTQVERDPMSAEIESARETVRQFIFAVRAGRWDVAARYASPGLPLDQMKSAQWTEYFSKISRADVSSDDTRTKGGLLLLVRMEVRGDPSYLPDFLVDPETGLIVRAFFRSPENIYSQLPDPAGFTDPETEANSLKRFGLTTNVDLPSPVHGGSAGLGFSERDGTLGGVYRVGGDISAPVPTFSPEAVFSDEARREKYQGDCVVGLVVDAQGNPQNVHIVRGLGKGLDEKAIEAVKRYRFTPAMRNGITPVPVYVNMEVQFRLY
jgi:TonB family protein